MALRTIVLDGDPILRKVCRPVEKFDDRLAQLLDDMAETMHKTEGAGLAAPQVGVMRRAIVVDVGDEKGVVELVNPEIVAAAGEQEGHEGCLSFPGKWGIVTRPMTVTVRAQDRRGEWFEITGEALKARAFCHEIDHLNGVCFVDIAKRMLEPGEEE